MFPIGSYVFNGAIEGAITNVYKNPESNHSFPSPFLYSLLTEDGQYHHSIPEYILIPPRNTAPLATLTHPVPPPLPGPPPNNSTTMIYATSGTHNISTTHPLILDASSNAAPQEQQLTQ
eukprot:10868699-Ditylum_brightwellii.AAC.1